MTRSASIAIRSKTDPAAPRSIACRLRKDATYHPWNRERVKRDRLVFVSFSKTRLYRVYRKYNIWASTYDTDKFIQIPVIPGEVYTYLGYGWGDYSLIRYHGREYISYEPPSLFSVSVDPKKAKEPNGYVEWLGLTCANGVRGWLLMKDIEGNSAFGNYNMPKMGEAKDGQRVNTGVE